MRRALTDLDGVEEAEVSIDEQRAIVRFRADVVDPAQMVERVNAIGFSTRLDGARDAPSPSRPREQ